MTTLDLKAKKWYYNRCDPFEPLKPDDDRRVDIDAPRDADVRARGLDWLDTIATAIELSDKPVITYFTGLPGSGKSTELLRLADRLKRYAAGHHRCRGGA